MRTLRRASASESDTQVARLSDELQRRRDREQHLEALLATAQKQAVAASEESADLRARLKHAVEDGAAACKRVAWESRKQQEAASAASAGAAALANAAEEALRATVARQAAVLQKQEKELHAARAQVRALRQRLDDQSLLKQQAAFLEVAAEPPLPVPPAPEPPAAGAAAPAAEPPLQPAAAASEEARAEHEDRMDDDEDAFLGREQDAFIARVVAAE